MKMLAAKFYKGQVERRTIISNPFPLRELGKGKKPLNGKDIAARRREGPSPPITCLVTAFLSSSGTRYHSYGAASRYDRKLNEVMPPS